MLLNKQTKKQTSAIKAYFQQVLNSQEQNSAKMSHCIVKCVYDKKIYLQTLVVVFRNWNNVYFQRKHNSIQKFLLTIETCTMFIWTCLIVPKQFLNIFSVGLFMWVTSYTTETGTLYLTEAFINHTGCWNCVLRCEVVSDEKKPITTWKV